MFHPPRYPTHSRLLRTFHHAHLAHCEHLRALHEPSNLYRCGPFVRLCRSLHHRTLHSTMPQRRKTTLKFLLLSAWVLRDSMFKKTLLILPRQARQTYPLPQPSWSFLRRTNSHHLHPYAKWRLLCFNRRPGSNLRKRKLFTLWRKWHSQSLASMPRQATQLPRSTSSLPNCAPLSSAARIAKIYTLTQHRSHPSPIYAKNATRTAKHLLSGLWQHQKSNYN